MLLFSIKTEQEFACKRPKDFLPLVLPLYVVNNNNDDNNNNNKNNNNKDVQTFTLRTFARKFSSGWIFLNFLLKSDNELFVSEMQKKIGGHRLRFRDKACGKLP